MSLISESQFLLSEMEKRYNNAKDSIEQIEQIIQTIEDSGINIDEPMKIFEKMKSAFKSKKYNDLQNLKLWPV